MPCSKLWGVQNGKKRSMLQGVCPEEIQITGVFMLEREGERWTI